MKLEKISKKIELNSDDEKYNLTIFEIPERLIDKSIPSQYTFEGKKLRKYFKRYYSKPNLSQIDEGLLWNYLSKDYNLHVTDSHNTAIYETFKENLKLSNNSKVLDWGVGTGKFTRKVFVDHELYGADISTEMIKISSKLDIKSYKILEDKVSIPNQSIDKIISCYTIHLFGSSVVPFREWYRILKPNSEIIFNHRYPEEVSEKFFNNSDFISVYNNILNRIGFKKIEHFERIVPLNAENRRIWFTYGVK